MNIHIDPIYPSRDHWYVLPHSTPSFHLYRMEYASDLRINKKFKWNYSAEPTIIDVDGQIYMEENSAYDPKKPVCRTRFGNYFYWVDEGHELANNPKFTKFELAINPPPVTKGPTRIFYVGHVLNKGTLTPKYIAVETECLTKIPVTRKTEAGWVCPHYDVVPDFERLDELKIKYQYDHHYGRFVYKPENVKNAKAWQSIGYVYDHYRDKPLPQNQHNRQSEFCTSELIGPKTDFHGCYILDYSCVEDKKFYVAALEVHDFKRFAKAFTQFCWLTNNCVIDFCEYKELTIDIPLETKWTQPKVINNLHITKEGISFGINASDLKALKLDSKYPILISKHGDHFFYGNKKDLVKIPNKETLDKFHLQVKQAYPLYGAKLSPLYLHKSDPLVAQIAKIDAFLAIFPKDLKIPYNWDTITQKEIEAYNAVDRTAVVYRKSEIDLCHPFQHYFNCDNLPIPYQVEPITRTALFPKTWSLVEWSKLSPKQYITAIMGNTVADPTIRTALLISAWSNPDLQPYVLAAFQEKGISLHELVAL